MIRPAITLDDVLAITYTAAHAWSPDGRRIGFIHDDGGRFSLRAVDLDTGIPTQVSEGDAPVSAFSWGLDGRLAFIQAGRVLVAGPGEVRQVVYDADHPATALEWSPAGRVLAFSAAARVWTLDLERASLRELRLPGRAGALDHEAALSWAPDGSLLAATFMEDGWWDLAVAAASGELLWRSRTENLEGPFTWLRPDCLLFARPSIPYTAREWYGLDPRRGELRLLHREEEPDGLGASFAAQPHPDGRRAVLVLRHEGWWHPYLLDTETGDLRALAAGSGEDVGHAYDSPRISPDGRELVFSTNRLNLGMRHLFIADVQTGALRPVVTEAGTSVEAEWSPDGRMIAFKHSTAHHAPEIWVVGRDGRGLRGLTRSMPETVDIGRLAVPQFVKTPGALGWEIPGYLLTPNDATSARRYPALVYIHGGGMRQMREGFPPLKAYAFFYAVSLWLAERGVVSLLVNYRGGIGYGKTFEQGNSGGLATLECEDCVRAGEWLKTQPSVDPERVGVWGLSYGGWLTLASLGRSPQTFALGINVAGIWDFDRWMAWAKRSFRPAYDYFLGRARGTREQNPVVWDNASPRRYASQMRAPLVNLHGTNDEAVPFEQLNMIVKDCVGYGKRFETHYYPDETHLFTHRVTWRDALTKVEAALKQFLDYTPEAEALEAAAAISAAVGPAGRGGRPRAG
jgi:dipeptidyl aminopeptidase/acylaminoacyl peptidase